MAKIIFHCGAHKTASSHLQNNLKGNKNYLAQKGIKYIKLKYYSDLGDRIIRLRNKLGEEDYEVEQEVNQIKNIINESIKGYDYALISYEGVFGSMSVYQQETIYPKAKQLIEVYNTILEGHEVVPLFVTREYLSYLKSAYKWKLKNSRTTYSLSEFMADFKLEEPRWTEIIQNLERVFGSPIVWAFEDYIREPDKFLLSLFNVFPETGIKAEDLKVSFEKNNESKGLNVIKTHMLINKCVPNKYLTKAFNSRISRHLKNEYLFIGKLLKNPMNFNLEEEFKGAQHIYQEEISRVKSEYSGHE